MSFRKFFETQKNCLIRLMMVGAAMMVGLATLLVTGKEVSATSGGSTVYLPDGIYSLAGQGNRFLRETSSKVDIQPADKLTMFKFTREKDGYYTIVSQKTGKALSVASTSRKNGVNVATRAKSNSCMQRWAVDLWENANYILRNKCSNNTLDIANGEINRAGANVWTWSQNWTLAQIWTLRRVDKDSHAPTEGMHNIFTEARPSVMALDVKNGSKRNGAEMNVWPENGTGAQLFRLIAEVDGSYRILNPQSGKMLDVSGASRQAGAKVQLWDNNGTCAQKWFFEWAIGRYRIHNACSGNNLDVAGGFGTARGTRVQTWTPNGTLAQGWYLE